MPDPSFVLPLILHSVVIPFAAALAALFILRKAGAGALASALAVAIGFLASYFAVYHTQWAFPPRQALDWLPWIVVLSVAGAAVSERVAHAGSRLFVRLLVSIVTVALVAWPAMASAGLPKTALTIAVAGALTCAAWTYLAGAARSRHTPALLLTVVAGGAGLVMMIDSSQLLGQLSGALAVTFAACAAGRLGRPDGAFSATAAGVAVLLLGALLANAFIFAGFSAGYVALLASGLLADLLVQAMRRRRAAASGAGPSLIAVALSAIPVLVTVGIAIKAAQDSGGY
ncbi:MAG: hypothetical protein JWQ23_465 [Herminiimonas sp.]|nr:hypothetical protein [Herminiimonas sp.]